MRLVTSRFITRPIASSIVRPTAIAVVTAVAALVAFTSFAPALRGQVATPAADSAPAPVPRWYVGLAADVGQPVGAFRQHVKHGAGAQAHILLRLDRSGRAALRLDGGWLNYGDESQRSCVGTTPGCRVAVNVTTANGIFSLGVGPQLSWPMGPLRAYGYGVVGMSRFATVSGLGGGIVPDIIAANENFGDAGLAWSSGVGVQLPVHRRATLDVGLAFQGHGRRNYLVKGGVTDRPDGSLAFDIKRSNANLYAIRVGVTTAMSWGRRTSKP